MSKINKAALKQWSITNRPKAVKVIGAQIVAKDTRAFVDSYKLPIFRRYAFKDDEGNPITSMTDLYRCDDQTMLRAYYDEVDAENRKHGFTGPKDHCPALIAENELIRLEQELIESACIVLKVGSEHFYGDLRQKLVKTFIGLCVNA